MSPEVASAPVPPSMLANRRKKGPAPKPPAPSSPAKARKGAADGVNGDTGRDSSPDAGGLAPPATEQSKLMRRPTMTKESTVIKSGLVKVAFQRLGMNHWKLRNMELCWDPVRADYENSSKVQLRLTIFSAKKGHALKRQNIRISDLQCLQIVSQNFVNRNVLLIQSDVDYYISTDSKDVLIDWLATLKAALTKRGGGDHPLFFINVLPGQEMESCEALLGIADNTLVLQKPIFEEMFYMTCLSSVVAFGGDRSELTWWLDVYPQRRTSMFGVRSKRFRFLAICVDEIIAYVRDSIVGSSLEIEEVPEAELQPGEVQYRVLHPELNDLARIGKQQQDRIDDGSLSSHLHPATATAAASARLGEEGIVGGGCGTDETDGEVAGMPRRITWGGTAAGTPTRESAGSGEGPLRKRNDSSSQSTSDLSSPTRRLPYDSTVGGERPLQKRKDSSSQSTSDLRSRDEQRPARRLPSDSTAGDERPALLGIRGAAATGARPPPSYSPPSTPPPAPPSLSLHSPKRPLMPPAPAAPAAAYKAAAGHLRPQKPPRNGSDAVSPARERYQRGRDSPDYSPPGEKHVLLTGDDGEGAVVSHDTPPESGGDAKRQPTAGLVASRSAEAGPPPSAVPTSVQLSRVLRATSSGGGGNSSGSGSSNAGSPRPVPRPRRRGTGSAPDSFSADKSETREVESSTAAKPQRNHGVGSENTGVDGAREPAASLPATTAAAADTANSATAATCSPLKSMLGKVPPAVPVRSDSITDASNSAALAAAKKAVAAKHQHQQHAQQLQTAQEPAKTQLTADAIDEEEHPYESIEFGDEEADDTTAVVPSRAGGKGRSHFKALSVPCPSPRKATGHADDSALGIIPVRDPPDGQEAGAHHSEAVADCGVENGDDEPIYVNLANCRLPVSTDSTDDEL